MFKIVQDLVQREKCDPEKANLLEEKHVEKRRSHYSGSRSKSRKTESTSSSEKHRPNTPFKVDSREQRNVEFDQCSQSLPFHSEKRDSWWFRADQQPEKPEGVDTCSCVSCALKKIMTSNYACMGCLGILFTVSVIITVLLLYKSVPTILRENPEKTTEKMTLAQLDSERLKRKIDTLDGKWDFGAKKKWESGYSPSFDPDFSSFQDTINLVDSQSDLSKILDAEKINIIQSSDRLRDFYKKLLLTDAQIRNLKKGFYEVVTFANTNAFDDDFVTLSDRAKRSLNMFNRPMRLFHLKKNKDHSKNKARTDHIKKAKISKGKVVTKTIIDMTTNKPKTKSVRNKRDNNITEPEEFLIESNTVVVQYKPKLNRIVPKCSHAPKELKSHETQLKHPFYKNTQRLDEFLDQFLDRKTSESMNDQFEIDLKNKDKNRKLDEIMILNQDKGKSNDKEKEVGKNEKINQESKIGNKNEKPEKADSEDINFEREFFGDLDSDDKKRNGGSTNYDILLSITTVLNPVNDQTTGLPLDTLIGRVPQLRKLLEVDADDDGTLAARAPDSENYLMASKDDKILADWVPDTLMERNFRGDQTLVEKVHKTLQSDPPDDKTFAKIDTEHKTIVERVPNLRKLLQVDSKDDENLGYEDLKEVLVDSKESHEENDEAERKKRNDPETTDTAMKYLPFAIPNTNWKGPMPLYPDELNLNLRTSTTPDSKVEIPVRTKDFPAEIDDSELEATDVQYIEDYLDNGYEKLVKLAQAYSDYGVLEGKKEANSEKNVDHKILHEKKSKLSADRFNIFKNRLANNAFIARHTKGTNPEDVKLELQPNRKSRDDNPLYKMLRKHVKISNDKEPATSVKNTFDFSPTIGDIETAQRITEKYSNKLKDYPNTVLMPLGKGKRTLRSMQDFDSDVLADSTEININGHATHVDEHTTEIKSINDYSVESMKRKRDTNNAIAKFSDNSTVQYKESSSTIKDTAKIKDSLESSPESKALIENDAKAKLMNKTDNNMSVSDFFAMLSHWFSTLDSLESTAKKPVVEKRVANTNESKNKYETAELPIPIYDADMIENIGHRSRVLLSIEDDKINAKSDDNVISDEDAEDSTKTLTGSTENKKIDNLTITTVGLTPNPNNNHENIIQVKKVKRHAIENNLIFWNDLYDDDEYGMKTDPFENNIRDKHSINKDELVKHFKKSNMWIQKNVKKITDKFNKGVKSIKNVAGGKRVSRSESNEDSNSGRNYKEEDDDSNYRQKTDFAALTARMKEICRQTAKDVQQTRNIEVRSGDKESQVATSLMQQLVRLMNDLVDYQVQERTCRRLPPDLQNFFERLMGSEKEGTTTESYSAALADEDFQGIDYERFHETTPEDLRPTDDPDSKPDCFKTLQAVRDLVRQYDDLEDEDKNKMTGVRSYLENQINYLQKQLDSESEYNIYNRDLTRFRRDLKYMPPYIETAEKSIEHGFKTFKNKCHNVFKTTKKYLEPVTIKHGKISKPIININRKLKSKDKNMNEKHKFFKGLHVNTHAKDKLEDTNQPYKLNTNNKDHIYKLKEENKDKNIKDDSSKYNSHDNNSNDHINKVKEENNKRNGNGKVENNSVKFNKNTRYNLTDSVLKNVRNIQDVYYKAMEVSRKATTKRDDNLFDKTDILR